MIDSTERLSCLIEFYYLLTYYLLNTEINELFLLQHTFENLYINIRHYLLMVSLCYSCRDICSLQTWRASINQSIMFICQHSIKGAFQWESAAS